MQKPGDEVTMMNL